MERIPWPGEKADNATRTVVARQLGRDPRGEVAVAVRCEHGLPVVVRTSPRLEDGTPFPTLFYLTCPLAVRAIGSVEASGRMRELNERLGQDDALRDEYAAAHERYRARRDSLHVLDDDATAGGMPGRVKCLHALYAHELADGNPIGAIARDEIEPLGCPAPCVVDDARAHGHPAFARKGR